MRNARGNIANVLPIQLVYGFSHLALEFFYRFLLGLGKLRILRNLGQEYRVVPEDAPLVQLRLQCVGDGHLDALAHLASVVHHLLYRENGGWGLQAAGSPCILESLQGPGYRVAVLHGATGIVLEPGSAEKAQLLQHAVLSLLLGRHLREAACRGRGYVLPAGPVVLQPFLRLVKAALDSLAGHQ